MTAFVLRGDARCLPLPDASVDLIVTSPPYFGLRSYTDGGTHYAGQIGSEATPAAYVAALLECTSEWMRVLKPSGSLWVNLGDKYSGAQQQNSGRQSSTDSAEYWRRTDPKRTGIPNKSLMGLPWRYALGCIDELGLILRAEVIWSKPNGLPESVTDRVRRSHEQLFHFTKMPQYFAAVDEIREPAQLRGSLPGGGATYRAMKAVGAKDTNLATATTHPLGKLPGSVWDIASQPLTVPDWLDVDHFAAFPLELPRRIILGWSPREICAKCGEGRRPVTQISHEGGWVRATAGGRHRSGDGHPGERVGQVVNNRQLAVIMGYACACTPFTDHPERRRPTVTPGRAKRHDQDTLEDLGLPRFHGDDWPVRQPVREYHFDAWLAAPTRPAVVLDPFGGTGSTALVASALGRTGISIDRSADYCRLAAWRTTDPGERAKAMQVPKPPPVPDGQASLFDAGEAIA